MSMRRKQATIKPRIMPQSSPSMFELEKTSWTPGVYVRKI